MNENNFSGGNPEAGEGDSAHCALRPLAERGDPKAQFELGLLFLSSKGSSGDKSEAANWFRKAAEQGHVQAQYNLGYLLEHGIGGPRNEAEAAAWYRQAAEQGHAGAQFNLGVFCFAGTNVSRDLAESISWFRKAAEQGDNSSQVCLGWMFEHGVSAPKDTAEAARWYEMAAQQGDERAEAFVRDGKSYLQFADEADQFVPERPADAGINKLRRLYLPTPVGAVDYGDLLAPLIGEPAGLDEFEPPIVQLIRRILFLAIQQNAQELMFQARSDGCLDIRLRIGEIWAMLPPLANTASAISRLLILGNLRKGLQRQGSQKGITILFGVAMAFHARPRGSNSLQDIRVVIGPPFSGKSC